MTALWYLRRLSDLESEDMIVDITRLTALELGKRIKEHKVSVTDVVKLQLDKIDQRDSKYHCYLSLLKEQSLERAHQVQRKIDAGEYDHSPLAGIPIAIKDNICTKGVRTTCASKMLLDFVPPYSATVIDKLETAGAIVIGKVNMDEFAMGSTTETSHFKITKNPWDIERVAGGSSGGAAAAVAAEEAFLAIGSDTGGSIRQPSAFCGVTGIKPTYGTVSRYGLVAYASSLDQIGPIARSVTDCAIALDIIAGYDDKDSTCVRKEDYQYSVALIDDVKSMKIGIPRGYLQEGLANDVKEAILKAATVLEKKGAIVEEFDLEAVDYAVPAYYVIASAEASSNLSRYDGIKYGYRADTYESLQNLYMRTRSEGFGYEVKRRMMIGSYVLSSGYYEAFYNKALKVKAFIKQSFVKAFLTYDVILGPTAPSTALRIGESLSNPLKMFLGDIYTVAANLAGLPAISLPCGMDSKGLPIGLQFIGKPFGEKEILRVAYSYERTREYLRPDID